MWFVAVAGVEFFFSPIFFWPSFFSARHLGGVEVPRVWFVAVAGVEWWEAERPVTLRASTCRAPQMQCPPT